MRRLTEEEYYDPERPGLVGEEVLVGVVHYADRRIAGLKAEIEELQRELAEARRYLSEYRAGGIHSA